jgi:hypothetical protein
MGLFNWGKKKSADQAASTAPAASVTTSTPTSDAARGAAVQTPAGKAEWGSIQLDDGAAASNPPEVVADIHRLLALCRPDATDIFEELWTAVFRLNVWHSLARMPFPPPDELDPPPPFNVVLDGRPTMCVYSTPERAKEFGTLRNFGAEPGIMPTVLTVSVEYAATLAVLNVRDLQCVSIDLGVGGGLYTGIPNLSRYYAKARGIKLADAARRIGSDPIVDLGFRIREHTPPAAFHQHVGEFVDELVQAEALFFVEHPQHAMMPVIYPDERLGGLVQLYTSEGMAIWAGKQMREVAQSSAEPTVRAIKMDAAIGWLEGIAKSSVKGMSINIPTHGGLNLPIELVASAYRAWRARADGHASGG